MRVPRCIEHYQQSWFVEAAAGERAVAEESSSHLFGDVPTASRIHQHLPDMRLPVTMRDPVECTWVSCCRLTVLNGLEPLGFEAALEQEAARTAAETGQWPEIQPVALHRARCCMACYSVSPLTPGTSATEW